MSSNRYQIMDAVIGCLDGISTVRHVSEQFKAHDEVDHKDFPVLFPIDTNEEHEAWAFDEDGGQIQARLTVLVIAYVFDHNNNTRKKRTDLILEINKAMLNDSVLESLTLDVQPVSVQTDQGMIENYSLWDQEFEITYLYDRATGG